MDSSRQLASIYAINFVITLHLILLIYVQTSDVTELKLLVFFFFEETGGVIPLDYNF